MPDSSFVDDFCIALHAHRRSECSSTTQKATATNENSISKPKGHFAYKLFIADSHLVSLIVVSATSRPGSRLRISRRRYNGNALQYFFTAKSIATASEKSDLGAMRSTAAAVCTPFLMQ